jgi:glycosyltransferase involved in cell wall biosynthesis
MGINFVDVSLLTWQSAVMAVNIAQIIDRQSAEFVKSQALAAPTASALDLWRQARSLDPSNASIVSHYAVHLLDIGDYEAAASMLIDVLEIQPRHLHLVNLLGVALFRLKAYSEAATLFRYCLFLEPAYPNVGESLRDAKRSSQEQVTLIEAHTQAVAQIIKEGRAKQRPTLSVCMIVKDEAEFIDGAVKSVRDIADEVIVVDTGSSDDTVTLARAAGADVHFFDWVGDFSKARNASLGYAKSDWILVLDADERLKPESRVSLRAVIEAHHEDEEYTVFCVQIKNYTRGGDYQNDGFSGRLFRNAPELRFSGKVHEEVGRDYGTDYRLDIVFDHFGADPQVMLEKGKDDRNLKLLELKLEESPEDLVTWFYVASQHWVAKRVSAACQAFEKVTELFEQDPGQYGVSMVQIPIAYSYVGLIRTQMLDARYQDAARTADKALQTVLGNPDLLFQSGLSFLYVDRFDDAIEVLRTCLNTSITGVGRIGMHDPSIQAWRAQKILGDVYFAQGNETRAFEVYDAVADLVPAQDEDHVVMLARLIELSSTMGALAKLQRYAVAYISRKPGEVDVIEQVAMRLMSESAGSTDALAFLNELHRTVPTLVDSVTFVVMVGKFLQGANQEQEAIGWYARGAELGEDSAAFWLNFAQLLMKFDEFDSAQDAFARAQQLMSGSG